MVSERTACDRLVGRLVSYGEPEGVCSRLGMGEDIAAGGGGAVAGDPGGMRVTGPEEARAIAAQHLSPRYGIRTRSQNRCKSPAMLNGRC